MPRGLVAAAAAAARRIRGAPASSMASCMVVGCARPTPVGSWLTYRDSRRAVRETGIVVDRIRAPLADRQRLLADKQHVAVLDVDAVAAQAIEAAGDRLEEVVAGLDERRTQGEACPDPSPVLEEQMAAPVEARAGEQGFAVGDLLRGGTVTAPDEAALVAVLVERSRLPVDVHAEPDLGVDRAPEEHRLLDLAGARAPEVLGHCRGLPVGTRAK